MLLLLVVLYTPKLLLAQKPELVKFETISQLDSALEASMVKRRIPGLQIGVQGSDKNITLKNYGLSVIEKEELVTDSTSFAVFSVTKLLTALSIMILEEKGLLELDDPIGSYLPYTDSLINNKYEQEIRIRHLLSHTSGLRDKEWKSATWLLTASEFPAEEEAFAKQQLSRFGKLKSCPGETYQYSNLGFMLLAEIVKAVAGESCQDFVSNHILQPLGMAHTYFDTPSVGGSGRARGYERKGSFMAFIYKILSIGKKGKLQKTEKHLVIRPLYAPHPGYIGYRSTAGDLILLMSSLGKILPAESIQQMFDKQINIEENRAMGLGWHIRRDFLGTFYRHIGGGPGFKAEVRFYENGFKIAVLGNTTFDVWDYANLIAYNNHLF